MRTAQRGVSLVEALIAMAVMAFGMMAIVALQATLRLNSDVSKQRSEAVRMAQEAIEEWRGFAVMASAPGVTSYADIASQAASSVAGYTTNANYTLTRTIGPAEEGYKSLQVVVLWEDRAGDEQTVTLNTIIAAADPALSGILSLRPNGASVSQPLERSAGIPRLAKDLDNGTSALKPPGAGGSVIALVFNNLTGVVTSICTVPAGTATANLSPGDLSNCQSYDFYLIGGFVRFAVGTPTPDAVNPLGTQIDLSLQATAASGSSNGTCFVDLVTSPPMTFTRYYCLVPRNASGVWTGTTLLATPLDLTLVDVCRYSTGAAGNVNHPATYTALDRSLDSQNFLIVDQGVACPAPVAAQTLAHQPPL